MRADGYCAPAAEESVAAAVAVSSKEEVDDQASGTEPSSYDLYELEALKAELANQKLLVEQLKATVGETAEEPQPNVAIALEAFATKFMSSMF